MMKWRVLARKDLTHDVFELRLERPEGFQFKPGQYLSIVIPGAGPGGRNLRRAYSIASPPEWKEVELCVKLVESGPGTNYLNKLRAGDTLDAQAPFGDFVLDHDQNAPALFIGTGTGLAPLRSMVLSSEWKSSAPFGFLLGVRDERDIIYPELFGPSAPECFRNSDHTRICLSRPTGQWVGFKGRVTDYLRDLEKNGWDFSKTHVYLCGSGAMLAEVKEILAAKNVDKELIHVEKYY